jgi:hypothetical protein
MLLGYKININLLLSSYIMAVESLNTIRVLWLDVILSCDFLPIVSNGCCSNISDHNYESILRYL